MKTVNGWLTWNLKECCDILYNKRIPVNSGDREKRIGDIPYYCANGLQGYIDDFVFDEPLILIANEFYEAYGMCHIKTHLITH